jgi:hypothetical protein
MEGVVRLIMQLIDREHVFVRPYVILKRKTERKAAFVRLLFYVDQRFNAELTLLQHMSTKTYRTLLSLAKPALCFFFSHRSYHRPNWSDGQGGPTPSVAASPSSALSRTAASLGAPSSASSAVVNSNEFSSSYLKSSSSSVVVAVVSDVGSPGSSTGSTGSQRSGYSSGKPRLNNGHLAAGAPPYHGSRDGIHQYFYNFSIFFLNCF